AQLTGGPGADVALECVGRPETPQLAANLIRRRGIAVLVGVFDSPGTFDFSTITFSEKTVIGSSIYIDEGEMAVSLMADGRLDPTPLITSVVPLADAAEQGFDALINDKETNIKVLLTVQ
ncbi:MAG: zinc-binding dehydrogenase, partial [Dehalococcoidales bacterium]|nr:zinc-binding dehydrogenase [Dehalococcoidales bacterium]